MKVESWPIDKVIPYARNPRKNDASVDAVAASIKEFGWRVPIVVDEAGVIITGHTRHKAARRLGMKSVPVHVAAGLTPAQVKAYRIADNSAGSKSEWDADLLKIELTDIPDFDQAAFNLDLDALGMNDAPEGEADAEPQVDRAEELNEKWKVNTGDLWLIGDHRLLCGDSTNAADVARVMGGDKVSLCFTSPPYNAGKYTLTGNVVKKDKTSRYAGQTDNRCEDDYVSFLCGFTDAALTHCELVAVNIQQLANNKHAVLKWAARYADHFVDRAVWYKGRGNPAFAPSVMDSRFEDIWIWSPREKPKRTITTADFRGTVPNVVESTGASAENDNAETHAATMPMAVCVYAVKSWTRDGACVYDPFLGSGTTMVAAQNLGRKCYGIEISPGYCAVILERMVTAFPEIDVRRA